MSIRLIILITTSLISPYVLCRNEMCKFFTSFESQSYFDRKTFRERLLEFHIFNGLGLTTASCTKELLNYTNSATHSTILISKCEEYIHKVSREFYSEILDNLSHIDDTKSLRPSYILLTLIVKKNTSICVIGNILQKDINFLTNLADALDGYVVNSSHSSLLSHSSNSSAFPFDSYFIYGESSLQLNYHTSAPILWERNITKVNKPDREVIDISTSWIAATPVYYWSSDRNAHDLSQTWVGLANDFPGMFTTVYRNASLKVKEPLWDSIRAGKDLRMKPMKDLYPSYDLFPSNIPEQTSPVLIVSFPYNGEPVALLHIEYLFDYIDKFIIIEAKWTFSGLKKPFLYFYRNYRSFLPFAAKIQFIVIESFPTMPDIYMYYQDIIHKKENESIASFSDSYTGVHPREVYEAVYREHYQRDLVSEYVIDNYNHMNYILAIVDSDEIISRQLALAMPSIYSNIEPMVSLQMSFFYYNFRWSKKSPWMLPLLVTDRFIQGIGVSDFRIYPYERLFFTSAGWHCSYCLPFADIARKLVSFAHLEFSSHEYTNMDNILDSIRTGRDLLSRGSSEDMVPNDPLLLPQEFHGFQRFLETTYTPQFQEREARNRLRNFHIFLTALHSHHLPVAYGLQDALNRIGYNHVDIVINGLDLSQVERARARYVERLEKDRLKDPDSRYGVQPLQLLQIVLVDRSFFEDPYHETVLLLPAYVAYYIDDNDPSSMQRNLNMVSVQHLLSGAAAILVWHSHQVEVLSSIVRNSQKESDFNHHVNCKVIPMYMRPLYPYLHRRFESREIVAPVNDITIYVSGKPTALLISSVRTLKMQAAVDFVTLVANVDVEGHDHWNDTIARDFLFVQSKVVIVILGVDGSTAGEELVMVRYLLSLGLCVMATSDSELPLAPSLPRLHSDKGEVDSTWMLYPTLFHSYESAARVIRNVSAQRECEQAGWQMHNMMQESDSALKAAISALTNDSRVFEFGNRVL